MEEITKKVKGFVYVVSRLGVTGARQDLQGSTLELLKRIRPRTKLPLCAGFGISNPEHVRSVLEAGADGAIVGSALVKIIENKLNNKQVMLNNIGAFIKQLKQATR